MIKALIFDMDGTLFDTEKLYYKGWKKVAEEEGYDIPDELLDTMRGGSLDVCAAIFNDFFKGEKEFWREREKRQRHIREAVEKDGIPYKKGLPELFSYIREKGYKTALATSTHRDMVDYYLSKCDMREKLNVIMTGDMVENGKPAPDIFIMAAEKLGLRPEECAVVEDSKNGIRAGYASGSYVIHIPDMEKITENEEKMISVKLSSLDKICGWLEEKNRS